MKGKVDTLLYAHVLAGLVEDKLIDPLQVVYDATKEWVKIALSNLVGEVIIGIIQKGGWTRC